MKLAALCDTSGNYIGEIEIGRRIPSFEMIEDIAAALQIPSHQLFMQEEQDQGNEKEPAAKDFLIELPHTIKEEITAHLVSALQHCIKESFDAKNY